MRERWVIDRRNGKLIPASEYTPPEHDRGPVVIKDIEPYKSMITGERIRSRSHHRDHLRAHGCFEVGNERIRQKEKHLPQVEPAIKQAIEQLRSR